MTEINETYKKLYNTLTKKPDYDILQYCYDQQLMITPAAIYGRTPPAELPADIIDVCARRAVYAAYLLSLHAAAGDGGDIGTRYLSMFADGQITQKWAQIGDSGGLDEDLGLRQILWDIPQAKYLRYQQLRRV